MGFSFYNTMAREIVPFAPREEGVVRIYSCGPTVYNYAHIGNFRSYMFADVLRRSLQLGGYRVEHALNITDVDDKTIQGTLQESEGGLENLRSFTDRYTQAFFDDLDSLHIGPFEHHPRATDSIPTMVDLVQRIEASGLTYTHDGSVYFSIAKKKDYGKLSKIDLASVVKGERVASDEYEKEDAKDFVLWKAEKPTEKMAWDTPIGRGRPGWHLECSAMIHQIFSGPIDIHTGGVDLIFPHHENEIAQSETAYNQPLAHYWMHCEHLLVDGQKMSKSRGNFFTLRDLQEKGNSSAAIRYLLLSVHYRQKMNFTADALEQSQTAVDRYLSTIARIHETAAVSGAELSSESITQFQKEFLEHLEADLNTPRALAVVHEAIRFANHSMDQGITEQGREMLLVLFQYFDRVLALSEYSQKDSVPSELEELARQRQQARADKNFAMADELRQKILAAGYEVRDTPMGPKLEKL